MYIIYIIEYDLASFARTVYKDRHTVHGSKFFRVTGEPQILSAREGARGSWKGVG